MIEATSHMTRNGKLHTGDLGLKIKIGHMRITGTCLATVVGGLNIYPAEIEGFLAQHPKVQESAIFGVPDATSGEEAMAFVTNRTDT